MAFARWDPLFDLLTLHEQIGQLVGLDGPGWTPLADLYEHSTAFVITVELPGVRRDDIQIQAEETRIIIHGQRVGRPMTCEQFHRIERGHGAFWRAFMLPEPIDTERVTADLKDGLLTVTLPKAGWQDTRQIDVS
jgi:HSP20 family protein